MKSRKNTTALAYSDRLTPQSLYGLTKQNNRKHNKSIESINEKITVVSEKQYLTKQEIDSQISTNKRWQNLEKYIERKKSEKDKNDAYSVASDIKQNEV